VCVTGDITFTTWRFHKYRVQFQFGCQVQGVGVVMTGALSAEDPGCECRLEVGCSISATCINIPPPECVKKPLTTAINIRYT
jgi:hypothetical protein